MLWFGFLTQTLLTNQRFGYCWTVLAQYLSFFFFPLCLCLLGAGRGHSWNIWTKLEVYSLPHNAMFMNKNWEWRKKRGRVSSAPAGWALVCLARWWAITSFVFLVFILFIKLSLSQSMSFLPFGLLVLLPVMLIGEIEWVAVRVFSSWPGSTQHSVFSSLKKKNGKNQSDRVLPLKTPTFYLLQQPFWKQVWSIQNASYHLYVLSSS